MNNGGRAALLTAIALAAILLGTCSDTNIVELLTTEVKAANHKFLAVTSTDPLPNATNVDPGKRITIVFDRDIAADEGVLTSSSFTISPAPVASGFVWNVSYNSSTYTLSLEPYPYLENETDYTLTITRAVKGVDGSDLQTEVVWSFRTGLFPRGYLKIENDAALTNKTNVTLNLWYNEVADKVRFGNSEAELLDGVWIAVPGATYSPFAIPAGDGTKTVYVQFYSNSSSAQSSIKSDAIVLDQTPPSVDAGPQRSTNTTLSFTPTPTASDLNGIKSYLWTCASPSITLSSPDTSSPTIGIGAAALDAAYTIQLEVRDNADNPAADTLILVMDKTPPNAAPSFTVVPTPTVCSPAPRWVWVHNSTEPTQIFKYELLNNDTKVVFYTRSNTTSKAYSPKVEWPDYSRGTPPGTYMMTVWEMDSVGNLSTPATSTVDVTSVLPVDRAKDVPAETTFQWWTMTNPKDPLLYPRYYDLYLDWWDVNEKRFVQVKESPFRIYLIKGTDPSISIKLDPGVEYRWWVLAPDIDMRSPEKDGDYWSFMTAK